MQHRKSILLTHAHIVGPGAAEARQLHEPERLIQLNPACACPNVVSNAKVTRKLWWKVANKWKDQQTIPLYWDDGHLLLRIGLFHLTRDAFYYVLNKYLNPTPDSTPPATNRLAEWRWRLSWRKVKKTNVADTPNHRDATMCSFAMFQLAVV